MSSQRLLKLAGLLTVLVVLAGCAAPAAPAPAAPAAQAPAATEVPAAPAPAATEAPAPTPAAAATPATAAEAPNAAACTEKTTLKLMHWTQTMVEETPWWKEILDGFTAQHPCVTIENNFVAFAQYLPTLESMAAGDSLPDVFFGHVKAAELGRAGKAVDYTTVFDKAYFDQFFKGPMKQFTFDGKVYALPWTAQIFGFFVNDKIMKELELKPPQTWDELLAMTPKIKAAGYTPVAWGNQARNVCPDFFLPLVTQYGGDVYALDDLTKAGVSWDSEPVQNAFDLLSRLAKAGVFLEGINGVSEEQGQNIAYQGKAAMLYTGSWMPSTIDTTAPQEYVDNYSASKVPAIKEGDPHWTGDGSGEGWVVNAHSKNKDTAVEFVKYLMSPDVYRKFIQNSQNLPSMPAALDEVKHPKVKEMAAWLNEDGTDHILFGQGSWDAVANACQAVLDGTLDPKAAAAQVQKDVLAARAK